MQNMIFQGRLAFESDNIVVNNEKSRDNVIFNI
jgi:hypothetical protein